MKKKKNKKKPLYFRQVRGTVLFSLNNIHVPKHEKSICQLVNN